MVIKLRPILIGLVILIAACAVWFLGDWGQMFAENTDDKAYPTVTVQPETTASAEQSFFPTFRVQREKMRSQQMELLREIVNNPNTDDKSKQAALNRLLSITSAMEMELKAEGLLRAQGFREGVVIIEDNAATVVIAATSWDETRNESVKQGLAPVLKLKSEQITLLKRK